MLENERRAAAAVPPDWDDKLRGIQSITDRALSGLDPQAMLDALVERVREALQADTAAVLLLDRQSESWSRRRRADWRRKYSRASESRSAAGSPAGSRRRAAPSS